MRTPHLSPFGIISLPFFSNFGVNQMLIFLGSPPTICAYTPATLNPPDTYVVYKAGSGPTVGLGTVSNPATGILRVTLDPTEVDTLGDLLVVFFDAFSMFLLAVSHQVVDFDPNDGTSLGLSKLAALVPDPWVVPLPGAYVAGSAGFILGNLGAGSDPWNVTVPGAYAAGKAGYVLGNMPLAVSSVVLSLPNSIDAGLTLAQAVKLMTAVLCGVSAVSGFVVTYFDTTDTISRVVATLDGTGQRTSVVYDKT